MRLSQALTLQFAKPGIQAAICGATLAFVSAAPVNFAAAQEEAAADEVTERVLAEDEPAVAKKSKSAADALYQQAYKLTSSAESVDDFSQIIDLCQQGLVDESNERYTAYYRQLMAWAFNRRGELLADEGQNDEAMLDFEEAIKLNPQRWQAIHNRAITFAMQGDYERAMKDLNRTIELKPDHANARFNRGELLYDQGDYRRAIDDYNHAVRLSPKDSSALNSRGHAHYKLGDYQQAIRDYNDAIRHDPTNAAAYTNRGDAYADKGDFGRASSDYRAAIRVDPKLGRAYQSAAWLLATCPDAKYRDSNLALEAAQKALELDGEDDYRYLDTLAAAYANAGDFAQAAELQKKVVALAPSDQADRYEQRLALYQTDKPYRDVLQQPAPTAKSGRRSAPTSRNPSAQRQR